MLDFQRTRALLDEINEAVSRYDPVLKERARDLLLERAFEQEAHASSDGEGNAGTARGRKRGRGKPGATGGFDDLLGRWTPSRASEQALLATYHLSREGGTETLTSQAINAVLKRHGLKVSNITRALETSVNASPPRIEQVRKRGDTKQARKEYRLTPDGVALVEAKLRG